MSKIKEYEIMPSTIETIDRAFFTWLSEGVNVHATTNKGWNKVPVIWLSAERAFQIKNDKELRDSTGALKLPIISVEKQSIIKDPVDKGGHFAALPENINYPNDKMTSVRGGVREINRRIEQKKTSEFANEATNSNKHITDKTKNGKVVYESILIPVPVYLNIVYNIVIKTDYVQQMNEIISTFVNKPNSSAINSVVIEADGHIYEAFIDGNYKQKSNVGNIGESEKTYEASLTVKVLGYLLGSGKNDDKPKVVVKQNRIEVKISRERAAMGDINPYLDRDKDFREF